MYSYHAFFIYVITPVASIILQFLLGGNKPKLELANQGTLFVIETFSLTYIAVFFVYDMNIEAILIATIIALASYAIMVKLGSKFIKVS